MKQSSTRGVGGRVGCDHDCIEDVQLNCWAGSPLADVAAVRHRCLSGVDGQSTAKGNLPRNSSAQAQVREDAWVSGCQGMNVHYTLDVTL